MAGRDPHSSPTRREKRSMSLSVTSQRVARTAMHLPLFFAYFESQGWGAARCLWHAAASEEVSVRHGGRLEVAVLGDGAGGAAHEPDDFAALIRDA